MKKRVFVTAASVALFASGVIAVPASSADCAVTRYRNYSEHYARITDYTGGCVKVGARTTFNPAGSVTVQGPWTYGTHQATTAKNKIMQSAAFYSN